jgi:polysaccharide export outer membrane protein
MADSIQSISMKLPTAMIFAWTLAGSILPVRAETLIGPGDVVEVTVANLPELRQRATVQDDDTIVLTAAGAIAVGGLSESAMRSKIQRTLSATAIRLHGLDGRDGVTTVEADAVSVTVAEYRPLYISGDVVRPGAQPYRIGINVRQALSMAGGYGSAEMKTADPMQIVELRTEQDALWTQLASEQALVWRLNAELGSPDPFDRTIFADTPVSDEEISRILDLETKVLRSRREDQTREASFLQQAAGKVQESITVVSHQKDDETKGTEADLQDLQSLTELLRRGDATSPRVNEARRAVLLSSTRNLQTQAELLRLASQHDDLVGQLTKAVDQRRIAVLQELVVATDTLNATKIRLAGVEEKMRLFGVSSPDRGENAERRTLTLFRRKGALEAQMEAREDMELQPGDVIEVVVGRQEKRRLSAR